MGPTLGLRITSDNCETGNIKTETVTYFVGTKGSMSSVGLHKYSFFFAQVFIPLGFSSQGFNEAALNARHMHMNIYSFFFLV